MVKRLKERYKKFREWQQQPHRVAPMSNEWHDCATCGTHFEGNYCPRCGQSAQIGRYSFKKAFLLFLDVWGLGNRGMFRTLRDLLFRPGYMIRDYLQGMQMAYYPPFKMFFLLVALSLLVATGLNLKMENRIETAEKEFHEGMNKAFAEKDTAIVSSVGSTDKQTKQLSAKDVEKAEKIKEINTDVESFAEKVYDWIMKYISIVSIVALLLFSGPLYLLFRKNKGYPDMSFSEFFVAMVYSMNMLEVYSIVTGFLCLNVMLEPILYVLIIIPIKQLSGYSYWRTLLNFVIAMIMFLVMFIVVMIVVGIIVAVYKVVFAA
jgi:hypothetical protein